MKSVSVDIVSEVIENLARICHEANRALCVTIGEDQPSWDNAPDWQKDSARAGVSFHLSADHGPEASHENWMKQKIEDGWRFGTTKDPELKTHPYIRPFNELPEEQQMKDHLFRGIVHSFKSFLV